MKHGFNTEKGVFARSIGIAAVATAALLQNPAHAAVPGITGGATNPVFKLVASAGYSSQPDGASVYTWGYGCGTGGATPGAVSPAAPAGFAPAALVSVSACPVMQLPGPTLIVNEGDTVTVNLANELPVAAGNTSIVFPGMQVCFGTISGGVCNPSTGDGVGGVLTREARRGTSVTYSFVAAKPGTYTYYSGTQAELQVEMGLYGALIVLPTKTQATCRPLGSLLGSQTDYRLAPSAYDHPQSCYDREFLFQLTEMDSTIHFAAFQQVQACDTAITAGASTCMPITVKTEPYHPNYFLINGRSMPDDMDAPYAPNYPTQPYNGNPHIHPGETMLIRQVAHGRIQHPLHIHGNHARVLARDANMLLSTVDQTSLAGPLIFTFPTVSGQTVDALFQWTGKGLNWDVYGHSKPPSGPDPAPCYPDANGYYTSSSVPAAVPGVTPNYGEWCADHNKPIPITPPDPNIVANGLWYGGTPYLGLRMVPSGSAQFISTPLPPGTAIQNPTAGYAFMWHSHDEREITTNDVFPGGMMMMLIIDPPGATIDETL